MSRLVKVLELPHFDGLVDRSPELTDWKKSFGNPKRYSNACCIGNILINVVGNNLTLIDVITKQKEIHTVANCEVYIGEYNILIYKLEDGYPKQLTELVFQKIGLPVEGRSFNFDQYIPKLMSSKTGKRLYNYIFSSIHNDNFIIAAANKCNDGENISDLMIYVLDNDFEVEHCININDVIIGPQAHGTYISESIGFDTSHPELLLIYIRDQYGSSRTYYYHLGLQKIIDKGSRTKVIEVAGIMMFVDMIDSKYILRKLSENANDEEIACVICDEPLEKRKALVPCGHSRFCHQCADKLGRNCPLCRAEITGKLTIFL